MGLAVIFVVGVFGGVAAAGINIDTCGQMIPDKEVAVLTTDLHCAAGSTAVKLGSGATLNLNGHTIDVPDGWGVWCLPATRCSVVGGGTGGAFGEIRGAETGVYLQSRARASINSVVIRDCVTGVEAEDWRAGRVGASAELINVRITGSTGTGVRVGRVKGENVIVTDNPGNGIAAGSTSCLEAESLTVTRNATSATCDVVGCSGIDVGDLNARGLYVSDNAGLGIHALTARLRSSAVVENRRAGALRSLVISEAPNVRNVACDASFGWGSQSSVPWGVCSLDGSN